MRYSGINTTFLTVLLVLICFSGFTCVPSEKALEVEARSAPGGTTLRLLTYNIKHGLGNDGRVDLERSARLIKGLKPDLVALQEIDKGTERTEGVDQAAKLGELTGMHPAFGEFMDYQGGKYGMALLSKFPIEEIRNHRLPTPGPSRGSAEYAGTEPRSALAASVRVGPEAEEIIFVSIHLYQTAEHKLAQAQKLVEIYQNETSPVILAGDFNSTPDTPVLKLLRQHWYVPDKGEDRFTIRSDNPRREIDFLMFRPEERFEVIESRVIDEPVVSDHRPVLLVVKFN